MVSCGPFRLRGASAAGGRPCQPISALNPYSNAWTIKAKVASKAPLRHFQKNGQEQAVFSVEVVDEQVPSSCRLSASLMLPLATASSAAWEDASGELR